MPLKIYTKRFIFKRNEIITQSLDNAKNSLLKRLQKEYNGEVKEQIFKTMDGKVILDAVVREKKNIAISENLIFSIGK